MTSPNLLLSELRVYIHIIAYESDTECICRIKNTNISLNSGKCGCIIPSANYTIFIKIMECQLVSNRLFIITTESCENLTQLGTTNIDLDVNASTLNRFNTSKQFHSMNYLYVYYYPIIIQMKELILILL